MPTGQVFRWHLRIMMQPMATSGAVEKPNSSAPSSAAIATSRPVCSLPSVCTRMRPRRSFITSTWCVSARPSSHGTPACLMELSGEAPVPPLSPEISTTSACALATPAATVPTPTSATSFTEMRALRIDVLQIVDELREILDGVDVVVRRRRDQAHAGDGVAHARDGLVHLVAGKLAAFAGLGALRHLDLQLVGVDQVIGGDAEARGGHLLDGAAPQSPLHRAEALFVFAALAGVGLAADAVHGDGQRLVRFLARWSRTTWRRWRSA